jgi:hypothetical protein
VEREIADNHEGPQKNSPQVDSRSQEEYNPTLIDYYLQTVIVKNSNSLVDMAYFIEKKASP